MSDEIKSKQLDLAALLGPYWTTAYVNYRNRSAPVILLPGVAVAAVGFFAVASPEISWWHHLAQSLVWGLIVSLGLYLSWLVFADTEPGKSHAPDELLAELARVQFHEGSDIADFRRRLSSQGFATLEQVKDLLKSEADIRGKQTLLDQPGARALLQQKTTEAGAGT